MLTWKWLFLERLKPEINRKGQIPVCSSLEEMLTENCLWTNSMCPNTGNHILLQTLLSSVQRASTGDTLVLGKQSFFPSTTLQPKSGQYAWRKTHIKYICHLVTNGVGHKGKPSHLVRLREQWVTQERSSLCVLWPFRERLILSPLTINKPSVENLSYPVWVCPTPLFLVT